MSQVSYNLSVKCPWLCLVFVVVNGTEISVIQLPLCGQGYGLVSVHNIVTLFMVILTQINNSCFIPFWLLEIRLCWLVNLLNTEEFGLISIINCKMTKQVNYF